MCGIAGYIHFSSSAKADAGLLKKMTDCIAHRGPDGEGAYVKDHLALGHRRLSIIDPAEGHQPMFSSDGKKVLVFNGEIYNYLELREELRQLGHSFATGSDTEVLIRAYEQWDYGCQNKFNGMWAFALWDADKQELFLSRDRIGEKPLHYCSYNNTFIFASELKSIFEFGVPRQIRPELTEVYLALTGIPAPDTFYKTIYKLMPGHCLLVKNGSVTEQAYWKFPQVSEAEMLTDKEEVYKTFESIFTDAVNIRMRSDVPFGAFLSGGLDSSAIVAVMSRQAAHPVKTFTIGFDHKDFDESALAAETAARFGTEHQRGTVLPDDFEAVIRRIATHCDEPFGDSSAIPVDVVSRQAAQQVKMVLTGDGGDEALSGYTAYQSVKATAAVPAGLRRSLAAVLALGERLTKGGLRYRLRKIRKALRASQLPFPQRMAETMAFADLEHIKALCSGIEGVIPVETYLGRLMKDCHYKDDFYKLMYLHYHHHLPNDYLVKVDRMSMANSLETRLPFLDYRLVEFMAKVHKDVKLQGWELKSVLRNSIGRLLPPAVLAAPKRGFAIPLREWFREEGFNGLLEKHLRNVSRFLDRGAIAEIIAENAAGKKDNGNFIWTLVQLDQALSEQ